MFSGSFPVCLYPVCTVQSAPEVPRDSGTSQIAELRGGRKPQRERQGKTCSKVVTLTRPGDGEDPGRTPARPEWGPANPFSPCPLWKFLRSCSLILSCRIVQWFLRFPLSSSRLNPTSQPPLRKPLWLLEIQSALSLHPCPSHRAPRPSQGCTTSTTVRAVSSH